MAFDIRNALATFQRLLIKSKINYVFLRYFSKRKFISINGAQFLRKQMQQIAYFCLTLSFKRTLPIESIKISSFSTLVILTYMCVHESSLILVNINIFT